MKKILIISYFYPPANFVGGARTEYWTENLYKYGIHPILITRQWNDGQKELTDKVLKNELDIVKNNKRTIYRLPHRYSIRDRVANYKILKILQKALTLKELIAVNFSLKSLPYYNFYLKAVELIQNDSEIKTVVISGRPFHSFAIGYALKKKFPYINWIADYRDEWNSHYRTDSNSLVERLLRKLESKRERSIMNSVNQFLTVSNAGKVRLEKFLNKSGDVIQNGYSILEKRSVVKAENLRLVYIGTLYSYQRIELLIDGLAQYNKGLSNPVVLTFIGIEVDKAQVERIKGLVGSVPWVKFIDRVPKEKLIKILANYDLGVLTNYENLDGCLPVKIFDYLSFELPTILYPSDSDLMEKFTNENNSGYVPQSVDELHSLFDELIIEKRKNGLLTHKFNKSQTEKFSRHHQTKLLAEILHDLD